MNLCVKAVPMAVAAWTAPSPAPVFAHPTQKRSEAVAGGTVKEPQDISLWFSERITVAGEITVLGVRGGWAYRIDGYRRIERAEEAKVTTAPRIHPQKSSS